MEKEATKPEIVINNLLKEDWFSDWLGIEVIAIREGYCKIKMEVRKEMLNGFGITHGGITYSLGDTCLALASNSYGRQSLSVETSISHTKSTNVGDILIAEAEELNLTNRIGIYSITITNQDSVKVAFFRGSVYRTSKEWK
jgi:acyl-CoA thioesterase